MERPDHIGATLILVSGGNNAATSREAAVEILALRVFNAADGDGVVVTRRLTDKLLADLGGHPDTCGCGICCLVELAAPSKVYWTAVVWQAQHQLHPRAGDSLALTVKPESRANQLDAAPRGSA